ncbi:hypothetical protein Tco_0286797, partial [Tanacetum coccineum]
TCYNLEVTDTFRVSNKVSSVKFLNDIGLNKTVTLDDALSILEVWRGSKSKGCSGEGIRHD